MNVVWLKKDLFDFSFSWLKSAVKREIEIRIEKNENISRGGNPIANFLRSEVPPVANLVTGTFTTSTSTRKSITDFWDKYSELNKIDNSGEKQPDEREWKRYQEAHKQMLKLNKKIKEIKADEKLSGDAKRKKADPLIQQQIKLARWARGEK